MQQQRKWEILIPVIIRAVIFILILIFKDRLLNEPVALIAIFALVGWSIFDFIRNWPFKKASGKRVN